MFSSEMVRAYSVLKETYHMCAMTIGKIFEYCVRELFRPTSLQHIMI